MGETDNGDVSNASLVLLHNDPISTYPNKNEDVFVIPIDEDSVGPGSL